LNVSSNSLVVSHAGRRGWQPIVALIVAASAVVAIAAPPDATILDPDIIWDAGNPKSYALSPDGKQIAYISRGAIWRCSVDAGPPTKLAGIPDTLTDFIQLPKYAAAKNTVGNLAQVVRFSDFQALQPKLLDVHSLRWTPSQDGIVFALRRRWQSSGLPAVQRVLHASLDGTVTEIASITRQRGDEPHQFDNFHVSDDRQWVVASTEYGMPLIWDARKSRPRATPFDVLLPSSTSDRYLGIEIDSRQLVLVGGAFEVIKRYDVDLKPDRACDLTWAPNEKYAVCRRKGQYSDKWIALRVNLETGEQRQLNGDQWTDRFDFTGNGGELIQYGIKGVRYDHLDNMVGGYLMIIPDGDEPPQKLSIFERKPNNTGLVKLADRPYYPPVLHDASFTTFVMALPRQSMDKPGFLYHFINRQGNRWPAAADDGSQYLAPGQFLAFANGGRTIVARDDSQLFSMPVPDPPSAEASHE